MTKHQPPHDDQPAPEDPARGAAEGQPADAQADAAAAEQANPPGAVADRPRRGQGPRPAEPGGTGKLSQAGRPRDRRTAPLRQFALLRDLLPVLDNIQRTVDAADKTHDAASLLEGVKMVVQQFDSVLRRFHLHADRGPVPAVQSAPARGPFAAAQPGIPAQHGGDGGPAGLRNVRPRGAAEPGDCFDKRSPFASGRGLDTECPLSLRERVRVNTVEIGASHSLLLS